MDIVRFKGGMGNQMFQYAFAYSLQQNGRDVGIDMSFFNSWEAPHYYGPLWDDFPQAKIKLVSDGVFISIRERREKEKLDTDLMKYYDLHKKERWFWGEEPYELGCYYPEVFETKDCCFVGYWQSNKYFEKYKQDIIQKFSFSYGESLLQERAAIIDEMTMPVFIHFRLNNYYGVKGAKTGCEHVNILENGYYERAISIINEKFKRDIQFIIFTDDIKAVKNRYDIPNSIYYSHEDYKDYHDWYDMYLMTKCHGGIIANSSFSWWAAYLIKNNQPFIIAPKVWELQHGKLLSCKDICPESWVRV